MYMVAIILEVLFNIDNMSVLGQEAFKQERKVSTSAVQTTFHVHEMMKGSRSLQL